MTQPEVLSAASMAALEEERARDERINHNDTGNARRFAKLFANVVRYAEDSGRWYVWAGDRWRVDPAKMTVLALTSGVVRYMREREGVEYQLEGDWLDRLITHAGRSESETARKKMIALAPAESQVIRIKEEDLDKDPWLLVLENGTLDLRTGELRASRPEDLCTRRAAVSWTAGVDCPRWRKHISTVTCEPLAGKPEDRPLSQYLQRAVGYALTGLVDEQKFWFLWGAGQNGKNVFVETILGLLGDYGTVAAPGLLTGGSRQHSAILADLRGARMVMADETGHERINDARVKMLTGSQEIRAQAGMGKDYFTYESTMKLWILGNTKPEIKDASEGIWRRMQLVPFDHWIPDNEKIPHFERTLREERAGILNWALEGLAAWRTARSLGTPMIVSDAVTTYRNEEDEIGLWLADCCELDKDDWAVSSTLYTSYQHWCAVNGILGKDVLTAMKLGTALGQRGLKTISKGVNGKKMRGRQGVKITHGVGAPMSISSGDVGD